MPDIMNFSPLWGVWNIVRQLGSGTFGDVYEARRSELGREYSSAIKHISIPPKGTDIRSLQAEGIITDIAMAQVYCQSLLDTLTKEIDLCYLLKGHTNLVGYEDHIIIPRRDEIGFDIFIRMELLTSLPEYAAANGMTVGSISKLCRDMCMALEVMEQKNIIHRDIKPANIFVNASGDYKLGDFGVARHMEGLSSMSVKGTYNYMAPEILRGGLVGPNSDLYSLGIVLYRLLNYNRAPLLPPPPAQISYQENQDALDRRLSGTPLPPPARAELSPALTNVIMRACEYEPSRRFRSAHEMRQALADFKSAEHLPAARSLDLDATVALERGFAGAPQINSSSSYSSRSQHNAYGDRDYYTGERPGHPNVGWPSPQKRNRPASNTALFATIFSVTGVVVVMLSVILFRLLSDREPRGSALSTSEPAVVASIPTSGPTLAPVPTPPPPVPTETVTYAPSTLSISGQSIPANSYEKGNSFSCAGVISSNYDITTVIVGVYDTNGRIMTGGNAAPNSANYIISPTLDSQVRFDQLDAGAYLYRISAEDASGNSLILTEKSFIVIDFINAQFYPSGRVNAKTYLSGSEDSFTDEEDDCTVISTGHINNGEEYWIIDFPITIPYPAGRVHKYALKRDVVYGNVEPYTVSVESDISVYRSSDMSIYFGVIKSNTNFICVVSEIGSIAQIIYSLDTGGYRIGWIEKSGLLR